MILPLVQVIFLTAGLLGAFVGVTTTGVFGVCVGVTSDGAFGVVDGVGAITTGTSGVPVKTTLIVGLEYVKLYAPSESHLLRSLTTVVATLFSPESEVTETFALTGALVNP